MADPFPTALQRTSDERWVTLEVVAHERDRAVARLVEAPDQTAVVRTGAGQAYDDHLRRLLASPPPDAGRDVHLAWPVDLLHDLDGMVVGYTALRPSTSRSYPLADFADPARRAEVAPLTTRRHLLRVARNVATATAALHYAGHARIRGSQFRVDERAGVVVVRIDELASDASEDIRIDDQQRLGHLMVRLLSGHPWASAGELSRLLTAAATRGRHTAPAQAWFFALRDAERSLPPAAATRPAEAPQPSSVERDGTAGADDPRDAGGGSGPRGDGGTGGPSSPTSRAVIDLTGAKDLATALRDSGSAPSGGPVAQPTVSAAAAEPPSGAARPPSATSAPASSPVAQASSSAAVLTRPRPAPTSATSGSTTARAAADVPHAGLSRAAFAVAAGLTVGAIASAAPFVAFLAVASAIVLRSAIDVGRRKSTRGRHQLVAIVASRLVPFATGGLTFAAFILLDLLLVLGLCMALAATLFDYGPGFTLTWILQLPEVPGLVRAFSFAVGAFGGMSVGGRAHDRIRAGAGTRRVVVAPALALALSAGVLLVDAGVVWWPIPPNV